MTDLISLIEAALVPGEDDNAEGAFCRERMAQAGVDSMTLSSALANRLGPFAALLKDGMGFAVVDRGNGDDVSIIGVSITSVTDGGAA